MTPGRFAAFAVGLAVFLVVLFRSERGFIPLLDHANLLFHEAGHPFVGLFSTRLEPYGGTLGQLVFPLILAFSFWRKGQVIGVAAAGIWLCENLFNIARYMADARTMELPLVGGGDHDWNTILGRWHALPYDRIIAKCLQVQGWVGIALIFGWIVWLAWHDRKRKSEPGWESLDQFADQSLNGQSPLKPRA